MRYQVQVVADERIPEGHDWMLLRDGDDACLFVRESRTTHCQPGDCATCPVVKSADRALDLLLIQPRTG